MRHDILGRGSHWGVTRPSEQETLTELARNSRTCRRLKNGQNLLEPRVHTRVIERRRGLDGGPIGGRVPSEPGGDDQLLLPTILGVCQSTRKSKLLPKKFTATALIPC
ncbi:hypothetical protein JCGZ_03207 [Jatropha curcas]|uniref:Uncharacterized protein n=1 Tax=Jatropha curcas TaxID=180498 RepID=A0A067JPN8_JATCU|nr:hypothetical protein JCGZ_03207 [Jatropha curcas]